MGVAALSQLLGAAQLLILIKVAGASDPVDAFIVGFGFVQAPVAMLVIGVLYPLRLAAPRGGTWGREQFWAGVAGGLAGVLGLAVVSAQRGIDVALWVGLPLILVGVFASSASVSAVGLACVGRGEALVGLAVLPNLTALTCLVFSLNSAPLTATSRMAVGLAVGNAATFLLYRHFWHHATAKLNALTKRVRMHDATRWLIAGAVVGYGGLLLLQAATGVLDEGDATVWGVIARVASFSTFVGVTAVLPTLLSWDREPGPEFERHLRAVFSVGSMFALALVIVVWLIHPKGDLGRFASMAPLLVCWVVAAGTNSILTSSAQRLGHFGAFRLSTLLTGPAFVLGAVILVWSRDLSVGAATISTACCVSSLCMAEALGWRTIMPWVTMLLGVTLLGAFL